MVETLNHGGNFERKFEKISDFRFQISERLLQSGFKVRVCVRAVSKCAFASERFQSARLLRSVFRAFASERFQGVCVRAVSKCAFASERFQSARLRQSGFKVRVCVRAVSKCAFTSERFQSARLRQSGFKVRVYFGAVSERLFPAVSACRRDCSISTRSL